MKEIKGRLRIKKHEHKLRSVKWDEKFGKRVTEETTTHATFHFLHKCECGEYMIEPVRHLLEGGGNASQSKQSLDPLFNPGSFES